MRPGADLASSAFMNSSLVKLAFRLTMISITVWKPADMEVVRMPSDSRGMIFGLSFFSSLKLHTSLA